MYIYICIYTVIYCIYTVYHGISGILILFVSVSVCKFAKK